MMKTIENKNDVLSILVEKYRADIDTYKLACGWMEEGVSLSEIDARIDVLWSELRWEWTKEVLEEEENQRRLWGQPSNPYADGPY